MLPFKDFKGVKDFLDIRRQKKNKTDHSTTNLEDDGLNTTENEEKFLKEIDAGIEKGIVHETFHLV